MKILEKDYQNLNDLGNKLREDLSDGPDRWSAGLGLIIIALVIVCAMIGVRCLFVH